MKLRLAEQGTEPILMSAAQFTKYIRDEIANWRKVMKACNLQP
jgi:tripartite-type tricarboxylate transporter receptor subunit TctC